MSSTGFSTYKFLTSLNRHGMIFSFPISVSNLVPSWVELVVFGGSKPYSGMNSVYLPRPDFWDQNRVLLNVQDISWIEVKIKAMTKRLEENLFIKKMDYKWDFLSQTDVSHSKREYGTNNLGLAIQT